MMGFPTVPQKLAAPSCFDGKSIPGNTMLIQLVPHPSTATSLHSNYSTSIPPHPDMSHRGGLAQGPHPSTGAVGTQSSSAPAAHTQSPAAHSPPVARIWPTVLEQWIKSLTWSLTHRVVLARKHVLHLILRVFLRLKA